MGAMEWFFGGQLRPAVFERCGERRGEAATARRAQALEQRR